MPMPTDTGGYVLCYESGDGIWFGESIKGYQVSGKNDAVSSAKQTLYCKWADAFNLASEFLTANGVYGAAHPTISNLYCKEADVKPADGAIGSGFGVFDYAQIDITYESLPSSDGSVTLRVDSFTTAGEIRQLDAASIQTAAGSEPLTTDSNYLIQYLRYSVQLPRLTTVPVSAIQTCTNCCNSGSFTVQAGSAGSTTYAAGTVVFEGVSSASKKTTLSGTDWWDVTYTFLLSPYNVNYEYNPRNTATTILGRFEEVLPHKYNTADFSTLGV